MVQLSSRVPRHRFCRPADREQGFVLVVVLSAIGILAVAAVAFSQVARTHVRATASTVLSAQLETLADAGVQLAILDLLASRDDRTRSRRFAINATPVACQAGNGVGLTIAVQDEAGKVDLNIASERLIRALLLGAGIEGADAAADAIFDYRDIDDDRRPNGAERSEYKAAGRAVGPKNGPLGVVEELYQVLGLKPADVDRLRPHVTVYSGQNLVDPAVASPRLVEYLTNGDSRGGPVAASRSMKAGSSLPPDFVTASVKRAFSVRVEARSESGATFAREAVIELATTRRPYFVRRWYRAGDVRTTATGVAPANLPPC